MVQHQTQSALWAPQTQYLPTTPTQPYVGKIHQPLVDINLPPSGGSILYGVAPITGGKPPYVAPPLVTQCATIIQPRWKQHLPLSQQPNWGEGVVQNPWGNFSNNPTS